MNRAGLHFGLAQRRTKRITRLPSALILVSAELSLMPRFISSFGVYGDGHAERNIASINVCV